MSNNFDDATNNVTARLSHHLLLQQHTNK